MLEAFTANHWIFVVLVALWFAAFMTGQGLAATWRPAWQPALYAALLGLADRFLVFALYDGELLSLGGYLTDTAALIAIALFAYRFNRARKMVNQYPWLYERIGLFGWRDRP